MLGQQHRIARAYAPPARAGRLPAPTVVIAGAVGDIVFGTVGHPTRLEYTLVGKIVNLVAKLEKRTKAEAMQALTTGESYALALDQDYRPVRHAERREARKVGRGGPRRSCRAGVTFSRLGAKC